MDGSEVMVHPDELPEPTVELPLSAAPHVPSDPTVRFSSHPTVTPSATMPLPVPAATRRVPVAAPPLAPVPVDPRVQLRPARVRWPLSAQLVVLVMVLAASGVFGYSGYRTVAGVDLSAYGWSQVTGWSWGLLIGAIATLVVAIMAMVVLIRTQASRLVAGISLVVALFLPPIALFAGGRLGFDVAAVEVGNDLASFTDGAGWALLEWLIQLIAD